MRKYASGDGSAHKKLRVTESVDNNGGDIISNLPESIISQILSHLPAKDVLRTCVLSKDWEYKWTSIYNIEIDDGDRFLLMKTRKTTFVKFVDRIFFLARTPTLKRFRLSCRRHYDARRTKTWISAALMRNVEDLEIVCDSERVVLPRCFSDCTSLTKLKLRMPCIFRVPAQNLFSNLKILYLAEVKIVDECVPNTNQLMFDFPVLETLDLRHCKWLKANSVAITKFNTIRYSNLSEGDMCLKISGPKLVNFEFYGCFVENFDLGASLVLSAVVDFRNYANDIQVFRKSGLHARLLLKGFSCLNHLKVSGEIVEAIGQSKEGPPLPKFNMLKRLELCSRCNSGALLELLHAMPFLESIVLVMGLWDDYNYDEVESVPSCISSHLNEVQFRGFNGRLPDVRMAEFLLTNAVELKKMLGLCRNEEWRTLKMLGVLREISERRQTENFWAKLKSVFKDGDFVVDSSIKNMADFELEFG